MNKSSEFLINEYHRRKIQSPSLTNAQFAKSLGIPSSRLSDYINGRRIMTLSVAKQVVSGLALPANEIEHIKTLIETDRTKRKTLLPEIQLKDDEFSMICDWYHFAIMSLVATKDFRWEAYWIAERINIAVEVAAAAMDRLVRMKFVEVIGQNVTATHRQLETTHNIPSESLRRSHKQSLIQVVENIDRVPLDLRDVTSITFAINRKRIPEAKRMIRTFRRKMATLLGQGPKSEVYNLNIQLFPVTKVTK